MYMIPARRIIQGFSKSQSRCLRRTLTLQRNASQSQGLSGSYSSCRTWLSADCEVQFLVSIFASVGSILYGYDLGVIAGAIASPDFKSRFNPTTSESGAVVSVFTGGAFFGAAFAGPLGDLLGRRLTIFIGAVVFVCEAGILGLKCVVLTRYQLLGGGLQTGAQTLEYFVRAKDRTGD